jgi:type II secretory pathway component PulF
MADGGGYRYRAVDAAGRRVRGDLAADSEAAAFEALRARGLTPLALQARRRARAAREARLGVLPDRDAADFLASLADLLRAGSDIRTALGILGARAGRGAATRIVTALAEDISGGEALDRAFGRAFQGRHMFVASLVAAGEAAGDLPGGLQRAAEILQSRLKLRDQLVSVLAYPAFVLASSIAAVFVILLFIVPSIAPLAEEAGSTPPASLAALIAASDFLRGQGHLLAAGAAAAGLLLGLAAWMGVLTGPIEALILDGPAKRTVRAVVFGGFAVSLGSMLAAGAPVTDALRLALRSVGLTAAQRRLLPLVQVVRQGHALSSALDGVKGFPPAVVRLAVVGEATNALGQMLQRGGRLEEEAALRRIETLGRMAGPALIVLLGILLGVLMGGLLTGVSQMGQEALG